MAQAAKSISLGDLDIDPENIRGVEWDPNTDDDQELLESVEKKGVLNPLLVRPAPNGHDAEYTIIGGGRRFNAAIDAGLDEVPCIVRDVDDLTAAGLSAIENRDRANVPAYKVAYKVIEYYHQINGDADRADKIEILADKFGCSKPAIREYIELDTLPDEMRELVKDPSEWSEETERAVLEYSRHDVGLPDDSLSIRKASTIARRLFDGGGDGGTAPLRKQSEIIGFAADAIEESEERVTKAADLLSDSQHRDVTIDTAWDAARKATAQNIAVDRALDVIEGREQQIPTDIQVSVTLPSQFEPALEEATVERGMEKSDLVKYYVKSGLKEDGVL